jgi:hypothetical protein
MLLLLGSAVRQRRIPSLFFFLNFLLFFKNIQFSSKPERQTARQPNNQILWI